MVLIVHDAALPAAPAGGGGSGRAILWDGALSQENACGG